MNNISKEQLKKETYIRLALAVVSFITVGIITYVLAASYNMGATPLDLSVQMFFINMRNGVMNVLIPLLTHCSDTVTTVALCAILVILPTRKHYGFPLTLAALGNLAIYKTMKHMFLRARPDVMYHLVEQGGYSFPSGHSATSVLVYGLLFYLIRKHCKNEALKNILSAICLVFAIFIGPSRLYVGVHWATDVICGMLIGFAVLMITISILEHIYNRK